MVASCAGAALGCYLVSLRVASERAALEDVETQIVLAQRDIRLLQTEIGTRGRLAQLERWNVKVLALSAPSADQFLEGGFQLARLGRPEPKLDVEAPVVLASAPAPHPQPRRSRRASRDADGAGASAPTAAQLMHEASLKIPSARGRGRCPAEARPDAASRKVAEPVVKPSAKAGSSRSRPTTKPVKAAAAKPETAIKKAGDKKAVAAAKPVTKPVRIAKVDPLAPLPASANSKKTTKEFGTGSMNAPTPALVASRPERLRLVGQRRQILDDRCTSG